MRALFVVPVLLAASMTSAAPAKTAVPKPKPAAKEMPADQPAAPPNETAEGGSTHGEGAYGGVVPGHPPAQKGRPKRPPAKGTLSWIGFEAKGGGSELFFQSVANFDVTQHVEGSALVVNLGLSRLGQNTWRMIDTRFFETPLSKVVARKVSATRGKNAHGAGIEVRITFKNPKDAKEGGTRTATEADGMYYVYLSFGGGSAEQPTVQEPEK
jgi:hypothetical protein